MKRLILISILLFLSCNEKKVESLKSSKVELLKTVSTENLTPNSYLFNSVPVSYQNKWYYLDKTLGAIQILNNDFSFYKNFKVVGEGPNTIKKAYKISLAKNFLFVLCFFF